MSTSSSASQAFSAVQHRLVVGTAGHIDHGKTRLLEALTGIDCDRWVEEKERGITIDLGFAHLFEDGLQIGFVDVPGHERFLHNALAGLGGIRLVLLVVAADEGVELQTREHLAVCSLLGISDALVALTKSDLVEEDTLELARLEVEELLEPTPFAGAPILAVSSTKGDGVEELRRTLVETARRIVTRDVEADAAEDRERLPVRLPVDRAFQLRGLGSIVTGTLVSGRIEPGQSLEIMPATSKTALQCKVRSVQVHGEERPCAVAGERTALQLSGVELAELRRGEQLVTPGIFAAGRSCVGRMRLLADAPTPLGGWQPVRFHLYAHEVLGRMRSLGGVLEPGAEGVVEIRLAQPVVATRGDRFVVRRPSPQSTLGGGVLLDPQWHRRRGRRIDEAVRRLADDLDAVGLWLAEAAERGLTADELAPRFGRRAKDVAKTLDRLVKDGKALRVPTGQDGRYLDPATCKSVVERARWTLARYFGEHRLAAGMPKAELVARILPPRARDLAQVYFRMLDAAGVARVDGDLVNPPGRSAVAHLTGEEKGFAHELLRAIEAGDLKPASPKALASELGAKPKIVEGVQKYLVEQGKMVRLPGGLLASSKAADALATSLRATGWTSFSVPQFKDRFDLSRKWAIPWLEHLDSVGVTRRVGDERQIVGR